MVEIFSYEEFEKYRVAELEEAILIIRSSILDANPDYMRGAMDMIRKIINLPVKLVPVQNDSRRKQAEILKSRALAQLEIKLLHSFVSDD